MTRCPTRPVGLLRPAARTAARGRSFGFTTCPSGKVGLATYLFWTSRGSGLAVVVLVAEVVVVFLAVVVLVLVVLVLLLFAAKMLRRRWAVRLALTYGAATVAEVELVLIVVTTARGPRDRVLHTVHGPYAYGTSPSRNSATATLPKRAGWSQRTRITVPPALFSQRAGTS